MHLNGKNRRKTGNVNMYKYKNGLQKKKFLRNTLFLIELDDKEIAVGFQNKRRKYSKRMEFCQNS